MASHTFTRQELCELVWAEPMIKLATRFKISGNGLAKACRRADIPVPERGYWARKQAGKKVTQTPLPPAKGDTPSRVTIEPPGKRPEAPPPPPVPITVQEKIEAARQAGKPVSVPATLAHAHRIVAAWLEESRREWQQSRHDPYRRSLHKPIDQSNLDKRRLRILSALFKALEARGYKLSAERSTHTQEVVVAQKDERFSIRLDERIRQVRRELTEKEKAEQSSFSSGRRWTQERVPTAELYLRIAESDRRGITKEWHDEPDAPIEAKLDDILAQLVGAFEELRLRLRREAEERERQWKIAEERRLAEMERKRETIRVRRLISYCDNWRTAADIRAFVAAVEASPLASAEAEEFASWKSWSLDHAAQIDPLRNGDLFDRKVDDYEVYSLRD